MQAVGFTPGGPENMFVHEVPVPKLKTREILVKVYTSALNRADTLQRKGLYPPPAGESDILGLEAAGTVAARHDDCKTNWKIGDRVMCLLASGGNAEFVAVHEDLLMAIPDNLPFGEAAAIPEVWLTAYQLMHTLGKLQRGESILIHAGGSGVGTAAIQLAKLAGAKVLVTAGSAEKLDMARNLGADVTCNYKEGSFSNQILEATEGKGVNLILDCIGASFYEQNVESIATEGRWVVYGLMGGGSISADILAKILRKRLSITGTTLRARTNEYKGELVKSMTTNALPAFKTGQLKPVVDREFSLKDIAAAHQHMDGNKNIGKIVLRIRDDTHDEL